MISISRLHLHDGGEEASSQDATEFEAEEEGVDQGPSRSRSWVAEEGEVLRKGTLLLGPEEMEGEIPRRFSDVWFVFSFVLFRY